LSSWLLAPPNANISFSGGSNFYGQAIANTISDTGGTSIYYDSSLNKGVVAVH